MSHRRRPHHPREDHHVTAERYDDDPPQRYTWIVYAIAMLLVGGLGGYMLSVTAGPARSAATTSAPVAAPSAAGSTGMVDERTLQTYRDILARDPKNARAAADAGNLLYDARRYAEAIPFYRQAMAADGSDVNVSTDLGTALWYAGQPDDAIAQYEVSLRLDPTHAQTLFNLGIVKSDGKRDYSGAVRAWETLLQVNPAYPDAQRVRTLIGEARAKSGVAN
ncbi:MAG: tetratricopeptide repeat protein [Vicinamibacterales bacterium]